MSEILVPPAQNSPNHILNILNDECIELIFDLLKENLSDFLNVTKVCTRFQKVAKTTYKKSSKRLTINSNSSAPCSISFEQTHSFLEIFGKSLESINLISIREEKYLFDENYKLDRKSIDDVLAAIAENCGNILKELSVHTSYINFNVQSQFTTLEKLSISTALITCVGPFPRLTNLEIRSCKIINADAFTQRYPSLEKATFVSVDGLTDDGLIGFQKLNSQLQKLWLTCLYPNVNITSSILCDIGDRTPNLTDFTLICNKDQSLTNNLTADVQHLSGLQKLKSLRISCKSSTFSAKTLIDLFWKNNVPLEDLEIHGAIPDFVEYLSKLKQLKQLNILHIPEQMVISCVKELPTLEQLFLKGAGSSNGIKEILENGKCLTNLVVDIKEITIDTETYDVLLKLARDRVHVDITSYEGVICIDNNILGRNSKWLRIVIRNK